MLPANKYLSNYVFIAIAWVESRHRIGVLMFVLIFSFVVSVNALVILMSYDANLIMGMLPVDALLVKFWNRNTI